MVLIELGNAREALNVFRENKQSMDVIAAQFYLPQDTRHFKPAKIVCLVKSSRTPFGNINEYYVTMRDRHPCICLLMGASLHSLKQALVNRDELHLIANSKLARQDKLQLKNIPCLVQSIFATIFD